MLQVCIAIVLVVIAFGFVARRLYIFVRSVRTKNKKTACQDCPLANACTSNDVQTGKCSQSTADKSTAKPH